MDITALAIALGQIQKVKKELSKEDFKISIESDRSILNKTGQEKMFYFLPKEDTSDLDFYDEYLYVNNKWDKVGSTKIDLTNYYQKNEVDNIVNTKEDILTEEQLTDIIQQAYPELTSVEIENIVNTILEEDSAVAAMINFILSQDESEPSGEYALLNSPHFIGVPTAPTAANGTNTEQIATTAFVQKAIKPTILINITDLPENTSIVATATLLNSETEYSISGSSDGSGLISLDLGFTGRYKITYNDNHIKGKSEFDFPSPGLYTINAKWSDFMTYTVIIDKMNANPETACTYADNAASMIKGSDAWDEMPIFRDIRPCVFQNGEVQYYLNPNDWTQKYGSSQPAILTGEDGDVMIEVPKFAYKISSTNTTITVSVSNDDSIIENDSEYTYDAFSRLEEGDLDYFYKGAFKGSLDNDGKLRSIIAAKPANNKTIAAFRSAARLNGQHYQQSTYAQLKALQCLYLIKYGNRDGQTAVGKGVVGTSESYITGYNVTGVGSANNDNSTLKSGMTFGTTANSTTHMRLFGIEDFWGNIWEWVDGLTTDGSRNLITSWNSFSGEDTTITSITTPSGVTSNSNGYVNNVIGNTAAGFMPISFSGSSSTYWADVGSLCASCVLGFGGRWDSGDNAGPFNLNADGGASTAYAYVGARLSYA